MAKLITNIQERIENSIYEAIRLLVVELGYTPDITNYDHDNPADMVEYEAKLADIKDTKGYAIDIFGFGGLETRGMNKVPRITMYTRRFIPSDIGYPLSTQFMNDPQSTDKFLTWKMPSRALDMVVEIQMVSKTSSQEMLLNQVVNSVLGARNFINFVDECEESFFIEQTSYYDNLNPTEGITTKIYQYNINNINIFEGDVDKINKVSKIKEITAETYISPILPPDEDTPTELGDSNVLESTP